MHVTRGAISRQVKVLEEHLGVDLFRRHARGVELTQAGKALLPTLTNAFEQIAGAALRVSKHAELRIICGPAISVRWLLPRLPRFRAAYPDIPVKVSTAFYGSHSFDGVDYDIGFTGEVAPPNRPADVHIDKVFPWVLSPGCSPSLLERFGPIEGPEDLARMPLLMEDEPDQYWEDWQRKFKVPGLDISGGDVFPNFDIAMKAAILGTGVVMADLLLCQDELSNGTLVLPWPDMLVESRRGWVSLICKDAIKEDRKVAAFRSWVIEVAKEDRATVFAGTPYA